MASKRIRTQEQKCIICKFHPILDLEEDEYDEKLYYHRDCRATFTHTNKLQSLVEHYEEPTCSTDSTKISTRSREPVPTLPTRVLEDLCIFCNKKLSIFIVAEHEIH